MALQDVGRDTGERVGINARLFDDALEDLPVKQVDGRSWDE